MIRLARWPISENMAFGSNYFIINLISIEGTRILVPPKKKTLGSNHAVCKNKTEHPKPPHPFMPLEGTSLECVFRMRVRACVGGLCTQNPSILPKWDPNSIPKSQYLCSHTHISKKCSKPDRAPFKAWCFCGDGIRTK